MSRTSADVTDGSVDQALCAINDARRLAQRLYTFKRLSTMAFVETSALGASFVNAKETPSDAGVAIKLKLIEGVWEFTERAIAAGTLYEKAAQIDFRTEREVGRGLPLAGSGAESIDNRTTDTYRGRTIAWTRGEKLFVNYEAETWVLVDAIQLLPDLVGDEASDWFIDNAEDWLLFQSAQILNGYLKEDQRVAISQRLLDRSWETFTTWDAETTNSNDAVDLE